MKTFSGNTISKKHIQSVIRTMNATQIFRLVHIIYGGKVERKQVYDFIQEFAPNNRTRYAAYKIAYMGNKYKAEPWAMMCASALFNRQNSKHIAIEHLRKNIARGLDSYTKRPIMGNTHLCFVSPVHPHRDFTMWQSIEINGNEKFCETICRLADKYFPLAK